MARRTTVSVFTAVSIGLLLLAAPAESSRCGGSTPVRSGYFGSSDWAYAVATQKDGKLVAAGTTNAGSVNNSRFALVRYTTKGRLDRSFGRGGKAVKAGLGVGSELKTVAVQPDGKIIAAGGPHLQDGKVPRGVLLRFTARGSPDPSFGHGGVVVTPFRVTALAIQRDGDLVAAGAQRATSAAACSRNIFCTEGAVARYTVRGALDQGFGTGGKVLTGFDVYALAVQADGRILALGGALDPIGGTLPGFALARYNADGTVDASFGKGGKMLTSFGPWGAAGTALAIQADGKIVTAGASKISTGLVYRFALARYTAEGQLDSSFGGRGKVQTHFGRDGCDQPGGSDERRTQSRFSETARSSRSASATLAASATFRPATRASSLHSSDTPPPAPSTELSGARARY